MRERVAFPLAEKTVPRYRWSERHKASTHCAVENCGARLWREIPTADHAITDATCSLCSRVAYELAYDGLRAPMTPEQFRALSTNQGHRGRPPSAAGTIVTRIARLLSQGQPMTADAIAEHLNVSVTQTRNAVGDARKQGHDVIWTQNGYVLEGGR
jgi:hypothetical protein